MMSEKQRQSCDHHDIVEGHYHHGTAPGAMMAVKLLIPEMLPQAMPREWQSAVWMDVTGSATDVPNPIKVSPTASGDTPPLTCPPRCPHS